MNKLPSGGVNSARSYRRNCRTEVQELQRHLRQITQKRVEGGDNRPMETTVVRVSPDVGARLKLYCAMTGQHMSDLVERLILAELERAANVLPSISSQSLAAETPTRPSNHRPAETPGPRRPRK